MRWAAPVSNGGAAITSYQVRVYRGSTLLKTVSVGPSSTSTTIGGLARRVGHRFVVIAVNAAGKSPTSAWSATVYPR